MSNSTRSPHRWSFLCSVERTSQLITVTSFRCLKLWLYSQLGVKEPTYVHTKRDEHQLYIEGSESSESQL